MKILITIIHGIGGFVLEQGCQKIISIWDHIKIINVLKGVIVAIFKKC